MGLGGPPADENGVPTIRDSFVLGSFAIREESDEELDEIEKMMITSFNVTDIYASEDRADDFDVSVMSDGMALEDVAGDRAQRVGLNPCNESSSGSTNTSNGRRRRRNSVESSGLSAEEAPTSRHRRSTTTDQSESNDSDRPSSSASPPSVSNRPNFVGGERRRRGSIGRRMRQRTSGGGLSDRRKTVGSTADASLTSGGTWESLAGSFGESLAGSFGAASSFASMSSFVKGDKKFEVGNLVFATDAEMAKIMYGRDENPSGDSVSREGSNLQASLPPSAMLGTGAFSTVRLAWRKTAEGTESTLKAKSRTTSDGTGDSQPKPKAGQISEQSQLGDRGELVAVKIIQKSILKQMKTMEMGPHNRMNVVTAYDNIEREIATMKRLRHPNLVRLFEVIDSMESDRLYMVIEFVSLGEILSHVSGTNKYTRCRYRSRVKGLNSNGYFDEKSSARYIEDVLHGLAYLHRDLKPENILLCESGVAKISDFGVACMFGDEQDHRQSFITSFSSSVSDLLSGTGDVDDSDRSDGAHLSKKERESALNMSAKRGGMLKRTEGTYCFWAPEMCRIDGSSGYSAYAADLWSVGICLFIFASGRLPFFSSSPANLFESIINADVPFNEVNFSENLVDILSRLLTKDPAKRAGVGDCLRHDFCVKAREERPEQIGDNLNESRGHIILSEDDVKNALSVTAPQHRKRMLVTRVSAPNIMSRFWKLPSLRKLYSKNNK
ncbi:hypothetical protein THAOC_16689 [Thalassiosira oceanica]|uniref:Protein kinase domain-containing protein n=1 Tax=Thalassiosira oceanica TaxID=159749 RepID=K0SWY5_THAOC|nr:hypothetical protein THAOC_16689 [Thalassiosira oceanica]|eukprot:EJK62687.1 hypothetical protein THAOC_16689 [Thalassiosira oceanica]